MNIAVNSGGCVVVDEVVDGDASHARNRDEAIDRWAYLAINPIRDRRLLHTNGGRELSLSQFRIGEIRFEPLHDPKYR